LKDFSRGLSINKITAWAILIFWVTLFLIILINFYGIQQFIFGLLFSMLFVIIVSVVVGSIVYAIMEILEL
jgi:hypothetical protein